MQEQSCALRALNICDGFTVEAEREDLAPCLCADALDSELEGEAERADRIRFRRDTLVTEATARL